MLHRVLEPELMDTPEEAHAYDAMDHSEVNRNFVGDLLEALGQSSQDSSSSLEILDLGTGTAQIPIELCRRMKLVHVVAVDAAQHMLQLARRNVEAAGLAERITLQLCDAKQPICGEHSFDVVMSNSIIHHLPEPIQCLQQAVLAARPGGLLFFRDLLRPDNDAELARLVDLYAPRAGSTPQAEHQRAMFAASLHAALALAEIRQLVAMLGFQPQMAQVTSDRHWTWSVRMRRPIDGPAV
jgi:ubiquinone/menaquinone biosynthesis C-methylase UbiE